MVHYRQYKLSKPGGRIVKGKDIDAQDDADAMTQAATDDECPVCEVWSGKRRIGSVD